MATAETATSSPDTGGDDRRLRRHMGPVALLFAGLGSIIGSGWLFGALTSAQIAGPAAVLSWAIGAVMIMLIALVYAELGSALPLAGGVVRYPHLAFGSFASFTSGWITWVAAATVAPIEVEGALQYATKYAPFTSAHKLSGTAEPVHTLTSLGYPVAVAGLALFVVINYFGIRWFARINNVVVWWKLAIICLVIVAFLFTTFHGANFTSHEFLPTGWHGVFSAIANGGIVFSYLGFRQGVELAGESSNPRRNVPLAVLGSVGIAAVIYIGLQVAFLGAVQPGDLNKGWGSLSFANDFGPLAAIATIIGLGWLATLLYIDAVISPADTGLIFTTVTARISYAMGRNENAPSALARTTNRGVPFISLLVAFVVGLIVLLPFPSWQQLVGFITSATVLSFGSGPLVLSALRRQLPDMERPFRLPGGDLIAFLAFLSSNLIVFWAGWDVNWKLFVAVLLGFVMLAVFRAFNRGESAPLDWRSGAVWVLPWLAGLALISYLGNYPAKSEGAGNTGLITLGWGILVILVFSAVIFTIAIRVRLVPDSVRRRIEEASTESAEEEQTLQAGPA